jgi:hypothetical protein
MKTRTIAFAALTAATLGAAAPAAMAMEQEVNMLTGAVYNALQTQGYDTTHVDRLTLNEIVQIRQLMTMTDDTNEGQRIELILERAADRAGE